MPAPDDYASDARLHAEAGWLPDAWSPQGGVRLNGPLERSSLDPRLRAFVMALLGLVGSFLVFQIVGGAVMSVWVLSQVPAGEMQDLAGSLSAQAELFGQFSREILMSNSVGQVVGLGLVTYALARLHSTDVGELLRVRGSDWALVALALGGVVALQPGAQWLAGLNQQLPMPDALQQWEQSQMQLIETVLQSDTGYWFNLVMMAVVPGVFEELAFRGYVQRQLERAGGPAIGIVLSGVLFGLYHLRPSHLLPLTLLGVYLAYLTWRTGSLLPAILVHFAHNALAVTAARYVETSASLDPEALQEASIPLYAVALGFVFFGVITYVLHRYAPQVRASWQRDAASAPPTADRSAPRRPPRDHSEDRPEDSLKDGSGAGEDPGDEDASGRA